jgi:hypothetical protein
MIIAIGNCLSCQTDLAEAANGHTCEFETLFPGETYVSPPTSTSALGSQVSSKVKLIDAYREDTSFAQLRYLFSKRRHKAGMTGIALRHPRCCSIEATKAEERGDIMKSGSLVETL